MYVFSEDLQQAWQEAQRQVGETQTPVWVEETPLRELRLNRVAETLTALTPEVPL